MKKIKINIPLSVPKNKEKEYLKNYELATRGTNKRFFLFAGDQKVEHLNDDFVGPDLTPEVADPEHYFRIANKSKISAFTSQFGLISKYGRDYKKIPYLIKVNSKTNLIKTKNSDPFSNRWLKIEDIIEFKKKSKLNIVGVGYTVYIGSKYAPDMFGQAARIIYKAHQEGLITVLWMYPRGQIISNEKDIHLIAGGAGVALCLGADFVKVNYPYSQNNKKIAQDFQEVTTASGRTSVICVGGSKKDPKTFFKNISEQINIANTCGNAIGRNIYQRPLLEAIKMANSISDIIFKNISPEKAYKNYCS